MQRLHVSIANLMVVVLVAAVLFAAFRNVSPFWAGIVYLLVLGILGMAVLKAVPRLDTRRMMWLGFAVFGVSYFLLSISSPPPTDVVDPFPPTAVIDWIIGQFRTTSVAGNATKVSVYVRTATIPVSIAPFRQIGHSVLTLFFGLVGTMIGWLLAARDSSSP
jgi:hypothetical protein